MSRVGPVTSTQGPTFWKESPHSVYCPFEEGSVIKAREVRSLHPYRYPAPRHPPPPRYSENFKEGPFIFNRLDLVLRHFQFSI